MQNNLLEQLGRSEVPPPPQEIRRDVHDRLNQWLLAGQIAELVLYAFGYAALQFGNAIVALLNFSLTGKYQLRRSEDQDTDVL